MRFAALLLSVAATLAATAQANDKLATAVITLHDAARNRDVPLKAYFPASGGPYPLIVFSPGYGGSRDGYAYLAESWAQAGYVVILPTHPGSDLTALRHKGVSELRQPSKAADLIEQVAARPRDVSFVIDSLDELGKAVPALAGKIDAKHIGAAGHSMGAGTTMYLAGAVMHRTDGSTQSFADPRIGAFLALSPQGPGEEGFTADSWGGVHAPFLAAVGSDDKGANGEPAEWRLGAYRHLPAGDKYSVWVPGANHMSFADPLHGLKGLIASHGQTVDIGTLHGEVEQFSLLFWNAYLKGDAQAKHALQSGVHYQPPCAPAVCPLIQSK